jgi:DNA ligase-1
MSATTQTKVWPTLYKLDNKGKIRQWSIEAAENMSYFGKPNHGDGLASAYRQTHGVKNGKMQTTSTVVSMGKNTGKANATTAWEQCCLEAEALWTKQRDRKGYTEAIPSEKPFGPMLAKSYDKDGKHIVFPCWGQPKLDGLRCIARVENGNVTLLSRQNKQFKVQKHIEEELSNFEDGEYDGELYLHDVSFQDIVGAIKRDEANELTSQIEYHIYDIISDKPFDERLTCLSTRLHQARRKYCPDHPEKGTRLLPYDSSGCKVKFVGAFKIFSEDDLARHHKENVELGYEGIMLRNLDGLYKINGRSADLQKYKKFMDQEFKILYAEENKGKLTGTCTFLCVTEEDAGFCVMPEGSEAQRRQYWQDWNNGIIKPGDEITVEFFSWTTPPKEDIGKPDPLMKRFSDILGYTFLVGAKPRFPIGKAIRNGDY